MLWPEGSAAIVADLGSFLDPSLPDEKTVAISVSTAGSFVAIASKRVLALFRLRPLTPLAIYPELFKETEILDIVASPGGGYLVVLTSDNRVATFSVKPTEDIEEALKLSCIVTPGPGEAIGARELWLEPLNSLYTDDKAIALESAGSLLIVYTENEIQVANWQTFRNNDPLNMPHLRKYRLNLDGARIRSGTCGWISETDWLVFIVTTEGQALALRWSVDKSEPFEPVEITDMEINGKVRCVDFNTRMSKLVLATENGTVFVVNYLFDPDMKPLELPSVSKQQPLSVKWSSEGTILLVGYVDGWQLLSMLGLSLYNYRVGAGDTLSHGELKAEWMVGSESVFLLGTDGKVRLQNMLKWSGFTGSNRSRPVLHGNGRLMLYYDQVNRGLASGDTSGNQSWLTIPLPTWYMAQNWPIAHICSSPDGRFVAVAGSIGIMLFSVATRQWKEIGDRESIVRGGLCWHGRRLIAATVSATDGSISLKMFSPITGNNRNSSINLLGQFWPGKGSNNSGHRDFSGSSDISSSRERNSHNSTQNSNANNNSLLSPNHSSTNLPNSSSNKRLSALQSPNLASSGFTTAFSSSVSISALGASTSEQQVVAKDVLGKGPANNVYLMAKGPQGLLGVLTGTDTQRLLIYDLSYLEFELVRIMPLASMLVGINSSPVVRSFYILSERQVLILADTTLLYISSADAEGKKYQRQVIAEPIEFFEYLPSEDQLWIFDGQDAVVTNWSPDFELSSLSSDVLNTESNSDSSSNTELSSNSEDSKDQQTLEESKDTSETIEANEQKQSKFLATISLDAYPIHFSSNRGVVSLIEAEPVRSYDSSFFIARPNTIHEVYIQYVVESALTTDYETSLSVVRKYRKLSYFSGILETLLYRIVTNEYETKDAGREALGLAIKLIREFPAQNFEEIVAGCARKVETKHWDDLFAAVGKSPAQLFDYCLSKSDLETASEFLIVVQTSSNHGTPEPESGVSIDGLDLKGRILKLYQVAAAARKFWICKQLCEFVMALDPTGKSLKEFYGVIKSK